MLTQNTRIISLIKHMSLQTKSKILLLMDNLQRRPVDIYCVPVGDNANKVISNLSEDLHDRTNCFTY